MKIQCSCGAKYAFDVTPEMAQNPVRFVCPACNLDSSAYVNQLVQAELAAQTTGAAPPAAAPPPAPAQAPGLRISHEAPPAAPEPATPAAAASNVCARHRGVRTTEHCAVCQKPICPQCLALFGYFCSPLCKAKAEAQNIAVPVYAGRRDLVEARFWRRTGILFGLVTVTLIGAVGFWIWYAWIGSVPHPIFSVRFADDQRGYSGGAQLVGQDQLVFLHGATLARYDLKTKSPVWSKELVTKDQIANLVQAETAAEARADAENPDGYHHHRSGADLERSARQALDAELSLHVAGQNVWVSQGDQLTRYDWASGKVAQTITLPESGGGLVQNGEELLVPGAESMMQINLATGESHVESLSATGPVPVPAAGSSSGGELAASGGAGGQPLNPQRTATQVQNMSLPGRLALPALVGNAAYEQRLENELNYGSQTAPRRSTPHAPMRTETFQMVAGPDGFAGLDVHLLQARMVTRSAVKTAPSNSALASGSVGVMNETAAVNEQLNDIQHSRGGDMVTENESRYQVTVHLPAAGTPDWTGEVVGPPRLFVLKTVNVVAAGKTVVVLDKTNKKLWQTTLTYDLPDGDSSTFGAGPCVEHGQTLYVFDQAVLGAFDLTTGNARWRLPSVGIRGLFFDDHNDVYVNTTTANPDQVKYSRQIDISQKTEDVVCKIDAATGKILWRSQPGGDITYLSGKYIYVEQANDPDPDDTQADDGNDLTSGLQGQPFLRLKRLRPSDGHIVWDYEEARAPFDIAYHQNSIVLVFKKEVQVLHYLSF